MSRHAVKDRKPHQQNSRPEPGADGQDVPLGGDTPDPEDMQALDELQSLLVGRERKNIERLEGALTGFISSVIRDENLDSLVSQAIGESVEKNLAKIRPQVEREITSLVQNLFERELAVARGKIAESIEVPVDDAIRERIALSAKHIQNLLQPVFQNITDNFVEDGRTQITEALYPEVAEVIDRRISEERPKVEEYIAQTIEEIVGEGMRTAAGTHITHMADHISYQTMVRNRRMVFGVLFAGLLLIALSIAFMWSLGTRLDKQEAAIKEVEKSLPGTTTPLIRDR